MIYASVTPATLSNEPASLKECGRDQREVGLRFYLYFFLLFLTCITNGPAANGVFRDAMQDPVPEPNAESD